jgi:outer membrane protein TolC
LVALYYHPSLAVARAEWRASQAAEITAGARPNPSVGVASGFNSSTAAGGNPWMPAITWDVPIETAGKRAQRIALAQQMSAAARWRLAEAAWKVRAELRASLLDLAIARARPGPLETQLTAQEAILKSLEQRLAAGAATTAECAPVRVQIAKLQAELAAARRQPSEQLPRVATALGLPAAALAGMQIIADLPVSPGSLDNLDTPEIRQKVLTTRADLMGLLAEYEAAQAALRLEIARQYPNVNLSPGYEWDQGEHKWRLGLSVELPVMNQNQGPIAEAKARRTVIAARFQELQAKIIGELDQATASLKAAQQQGVALGQIRQAQEARMKTLQTSLDAGASDRLELLTAALESSTLAAAELEARINVAQAQARWEEISMQALEPTSAHLLQK